MWSLWVWINMYVMYVKSKGALFKPLNDASYLSLYTAIAFPPSPRFVVVFWGQGTTVSAYPSLARETREECGRPLQCMQPACIRLMCDCEIAEKMLATRTTRWEAWREEKRKFSSNIYHVVCADWYVMNFFPVNVSHHASEARKLLLFIVKTFVLGPS